MKIDALQNVASLPPIGIFSGAVWNPSALSRYNRGLRAMSVESFTKLNVDGHVGIPIYYTIFEDKLLLYPKPAEAGELIITFYPPIVTL